MKRVLINRDKWTRSMGVCSWLTMEQNYKGNPWSNWVYIIRI